MDHLLSSTEGSARTEGNGELLGDTSQQVRLSCVIWRQGKKGIFVSQLGHGRRFPGRRKTCLKLEWESGVPGLNVERTAYLLQAPRSVCAESSEQG